MNLKLQANNKAQCEKGWLPVNQKERMLAELPYKAWMDGLPEERLRAKSLAFEYNRLHPSEENRKRSLLEELLGKIGKSIKIEPAFQCDYGYNIEVGENFYANHNLVILDVGKVRIGNNVMFGPNVSLVTAGHPLDVNLRNEGYEYGIAITIEDNVWLGANVVVNPGVHIGRNSVIGSGSVVAKDVEANSVYAGVPCRKIREITPADAEFYFKDRRFDF